MVGASIPTCGSSIRDLFELSFSTVRNIFRWDVQKLGTRRVSILFQNLDGVIRTISGDQLASECGKSSIGIVSNKPNDLRSPGLNVCSHIYNGAINKNLVEASILLEEAHQAASSQEQSYPHASN